MKKSATLKMILAMVIFGTIGLFRKFIDVPSGMVAMTRGFVGTAFLLAFIGIRKQKLNFGKIKENAFLLIISGAFIGFNWILLFEGYTYTSVAKATLSYYMAPVIVVLISPIILKEKLTIRKGICTLMAVAGFVLISGIVGDKDGLALSDFKGILFGLGAAVLYASVILMNKKIKPIGAYDKTIVQLFFAAIVVLPYVIIKERSMILTSSLVTSPAVTIIMLIVVGILHTGIAYALYFGSMTDLEAGKVALLSYIDPVVAVILSATVLREGFTIPGIIGAVLILGSTAYSEIEKK